jgi:hypothetical protein
VTDELHHEVWRIAGRAEQVLSRLIDVEMAEPLFAELVSLASRSPENAEQIAQQISQSVRRFPRELVEYYAHALAPRGLRQELQRLLLTTSSQREREVLESMLAAFDENWPDRDLYARWRSHPTK